jgi:hypothetical protein
MEELFSRIQVLDLSPDIESARSSLEMLLRYSIKEKFLKGFCDRLEGWWFRRAIQHLKDPQYYPAISWREAQAQIEDLAEQFRMDNLPIDFPTELDMEETDLPADERLFVEQLKLISLNSERVKMAISDYWRAFQQRSRWVRENLLLDTALEQYEERLVREWKEQFLIMREGLDEGSDHTAEGRAFFNRLVITGQHIPIRPSFPNPFVMRGSFHMLANALKVGWHPQFEQRLARAFEKAVRLIE